MDKRIYSLNLAAYVMMKTSIEPQIDIEKGGGNGLAFCRFPQSQEVAAAIREYKEDAALHQYLVSYGLLRDMIKEQRGL